MQNSLPTRPRSGEFAQIADWPDETTLLVRMQGALDFYTVPKAKRLLFDQLERRPRWVVIDVSQAFVDSSGIGLLIQLAQLLRLERGQLRVVCDDRLGRIFRLHELHELLQTEETAEAALDRRSRSAQRRGDKEGETGRRLRPAAFAPGNRTRAILAGSRGNRGSRPDRSHQPNPR